jgi:two-component system chemotaxis response regulator CheY
MTRRAIVIDDSRAMRTILKRVLAGAGFTEIHEAETGIMALSILDDVGPVDLCCVDWNMPEMNGIDFVRAVRNDARHADVTLMMVTTEVDIRNVVRALAAGANEYVMKPFTPETILGKLELLGLMGA